jgi:hypothetical protein
VFAGLTQEEGEEKTEEKTEEEAEGEDVFTFNSAMKQVTPLHYRST